MKHCVLRELLPNRGLDECLMGGGEEAWKNFRPETLQPTVRLRGGRMKHQAPRWPEPQQGHKARKGPGGGES